MGRERVVNALRALTNIFNSSSEKKKMVMVGEHNHMITKPYNAGTQQIVEKAVQTSITLTFPKFWLLEFNALLV